MDAIINNPFRILGLKPTASEKEITKRVSDLMIYAEMDKKVTYDTDFEFLGKVDRSVNAIEEAAKKVENNELKVFYSLLCFEIKDENDLKAIKLIEHKKYNDAIILLEHSIFNNCPIVYSASRTVFNILNSSRFKDKTNSLYSIKVKNRTNIQNVPIPFSKKYLIKTNSGIKELVLLNESLTLIKDLNKYQIAVRFKFESSSILKKKIGFVFNCKEQSIKQSIIIDSSGNIILKQQRNDIQENPKTILEQHFDSSFCLETNYIVIKKYDGLLEVSLNDNCILKIGNNFNYSSFCLRIQNSQTILIENLLLSEIDHRKSYSSDIELNPKTFSHIKNLSLLFLLKTEQEDNVFDISYLHYFELISNFYKQEYFKKHTKQLVSKNYEIEFPQLTNIFVNEFYLTFKNKIDPNIENSEIAFYSSFRHLSDEAEKKAQNIIISPRLFAFEEKLKITTNQRLNDLANSNKYANTLMELAILFFKWYENFYTYGSISHKMLSDRVGKELLECAIAFYNNNTLKTDQIANETIQIIKSSAEFAMNQELRDRVSKNLNAITKSQGFDNIVINFKEKDINKYFESISYKGDKSNTASKIKSEKTSSENIIVKLINDFNTSYKTPEYVYEFLLKCQEELISIELKKENNNQEHQKESSSVVACILTYLSDSLLDRENKLEVEDVHKEIEFTIFLEKGLTLLSKMKNMDISPLIRKRFDKNYTIFINKLNQHNTENEVTDYINKESDSRSNKNTRNRVRDKKKSPNQIITFWKTISLQSWKNNSVLNFIRKAFFWIVIIAGLVFLINLLESKSGERGSTLPEEISQWDGNQLNNGASPYNNYFGKQIYDYNSNCWLLFKNGNKTDAIVCLVDAYKDITIRNVYIRAGTSFKTENIPVGTYIVKSFYGNDWNPTKTLNNGQIVGAFDTDMHFSASDKRDDWIIIEDDGYSYTTGEITLYTVSHGNMQQRNINSNEFFK